MNKIAFILLLSVMAISVNATETRIMSLGDIGDYIDDDSNILKFPGTLSNYRNLAVFEGEDTLSHGSGTFNYFNDDLNLDFSLLLEKELLSSLQHHYFTPKRISSLMIGHNNMVFYFGMASQSRNSESDRSSSINNNSFATFTRCGFGYSSTGSVPYDLGLHFQYVDSEDRRQHNENNFKDIETLSGYYVKLDLRSKYPFLSGSLRPYLHLGYSSYSMENNVHNYTNFSNEDGTVKSYRSILGFAYERKVTAKIQFWLGLVPVDYIYNDNQNKVTNNSSISTYDDDLNRVNTSYLFVALESKLTGWLTSRIGVKSYYQINSSDISEDELGYDPYTYRFSNFSNHYEFSYGLAAHYKNFAFDVTISPDMIYEGPYLVTGSKTRSLIGHFSLSYRW